MKRTSQQHAAETASLFCQPHEHSQGVRVMRSSNLRVLLAVIAVIVVLSVSVIAQPGSAPTAPGQAVAHPLHISSGDLLELNVYDTPELSGKLRVNESGEVSIPIAGKVSLSGMTSEEAAAIIENKFRTENVLKDPHVSVFITEYATQGVTVSGEVKNPGIYPLLGSHTLVDLVAAAGGVNSTAGQAVTVTHKSDPAHPEVILMDSKPGSVAASVDLQPGDTISVSRAGVVYVVGDVSKPGGFLIEGNERLTALQAIALAQGTNRTAAQNKTRLIRKTGTEREEKPLELKRILANKAPDVSLEDGDIIFVPTSGATVWGVRGIEAAIALTTGLIIYGRL